MILLYERLDMDMYTFEYEIIVHVMTWYSNFNK